MHWENLPLVGSGEKDAVSKIVGSQKGLDAAERGLNERTSAGYTQHIGPHE